MTALTLIEGAKVYFGDCVDMGQLSDGSVNLIVTTPPSGNFCRLAGVFGREMREYSDYIDYISSPLRECVRVLAPDGKLCLHIKPYFEAEHTDDDSRRVIRSVLGDVERAVLAFPDMYLLSLFVVDTRGAQYLSSFGSYPYPSKIYSSVRYEWVAVFAKSGKRSPVSQKIKEASKLSKEEWRGWAVDSIWNFPPVSPKNEGHPEPTPPELSRRLIKMYSFFGDTVLDPYLGTGTTALEALLLGRNAVGFELDEELLPVIRNKLAAAAVTQLPLFADKEFD